MEFGYQKAWNPIEKSAFSLAMVATDALYLELC